MALLWALSRPSMPVWNPMDQNCSQCSRCGLTSTEWGGTITPLSLLDAPKDAALDLICLHCSSRALLALVQLGVHQDCQVPFSRAGLLGPVPGAEPHTFLWCKFTVLAHPLFQPVHVSMFSLLTCLPHQPVQCQQQTC